MLIGFAGLETSTSAETTTTTIAGSHHPVLSYFWYGFTRSPASDYSTLPGNGKNPALLVLLWGPRPYKLINIAFGQVGPTRQCSSRAKWDVIASLWHLYPTVYCILVQPVEVFKMTQLSLRFQCCFPQRFCLVTINNKFLENFI